MKVAVFRELPGVARGHRIDRGTLPEKAREQNLGERLRTDPVSPAILSGLRGRDRHRDLCLKVNIGSSVQGL